MLTKTKVAVAAAFSAAGARFRVATQMEQSLSRGEGMLML